MDWNSKSIWQELHGTVSTKHADTPGSERVLNVIRHHLKNIESPSSVFKSRCVKERVANARNTAIPYKQTFVTKHKCVMMLQLYKPGSLKREQELVDSVNKNIKLIGNYLDGMIIFTEGLPVEETKKMLSLKSDNNVDIIPMTGRMTYTDFMCFSRDHFHDDVVSLVTNCDCSFDSTTDILKSLKYTMDDTAVCYSITRNRDGEPEFDPAAHKWTSDMFSVDHPEVEYTHPLEPWSSDAWCYMNYIFSSPGFNIEKYRIYMGTNACEIKFNSLLKKQNIKIYNIGFNGYINCTHNHKSNYRVKDNWKPIYEEDVTGFYPTESQPRTLKNSLLNCDRIRTSDNWLDSPTRYAHKYSDYVVNNIEPFLTGTTTTKLVVLVVTTKSEIQSGFLVNTLNSYLLNNSSDIKFDIIVSYDEPNEEIEEITDQFNNLYSDSCSITHHCVGLQPKENIYYRSWIDPVDEKPKKIPRLGYSTGPNELFFKSMTYMFTLKYDNVLLIETDTTPVTTDWFDTCYSYATCHNFIIAGSTYKGKYSTSVNDEWYAGYLNGVGIYKNNKKLQKVLTGTEQLLEQLMSEEHFDCFMNYDVAIGYYLDVTKHPDKQLYKNTNIFTNISLQDDIDPEDALKEHPDSQIIHHKKYKTSA